MCLKKITLHASTLFFLLTYCLFATTNPYFNELGCYLNFSKSSDKSDLTDKWKTFLLQELFKLRMEKWIHNIPYLAETISHSEDETVAFDIFLAQITIIKQEGFTQEELETVKYKTLFALSTKAAFVHSKSISYDNSSIFEQDSSPLSAFFNTSQLAVEKIQLNDLSCQIASFLKDESRLFHLFYPEPIYTTEHLKQPWTFDTDINNISIRFADNSDSFLNTSHDSIESFYQLPLGDREQRLIYDLIKTMAEKNIWGLLFKKRELEKVGKKINHVHPMRFIGYILSEPKLKKWLKEVKNSSFKWDHFIDGFANRMKEENAKNNLIPYVPGMAHLLHVSQEHIMNFIHNKDYEGLVKSLI